MVAQEPGAASDQLEVMEATVVVKAVVATGAAARGTAARVVMA